MSARVLVLSSDRVGEQMAGPAIRAYEIATALSAHHRVTLAAPPGSGLPAGSQLAFAQASPGSAEFWKLAGEHDVLVAQFLPGSVLAKLIGGPLRLVLDLYDPRALEALERGTGDADALATRVAAEAAEQLAYLAAADFVLCASERQRDLWIGAQMGAALIEPQGYRSDPTHRSRIGVVPFGIPEGEPESPGPVLKGVWPGTSPDDRVIVWGGGVWDWLDPVGAVRAAELAASSIDGLRLFFLGTGRPPEGEKASFPMMSANAELERYVSDRGLDGGTVLLNRDWIPYAERGAYLCEADAGISTHQDHLEARYAYRTRVLDYFWAGLPVIATRGDVLADTIEAEGLGTTAPAGDVEALAEAMVSLLGDRAGLEAASGRVKAMAPAFRWSRVVEPLLEFLDSALVPRGGQSLRSAERLVRRSRIAKGRQLVGEDGLASTAALAWRRLRGRQ